MLDVDAFLRWLGDRGVGDQHWPAYRRHAEALLTISGDGVILPKHVDQLIRERAAAGTTAQALSNLKTAADAIREFQREQRAPAAAAPARGPAVGVVQRGPQASAGTAPARRGFGPQVARDTSAATLGRYHVAPPGRVVALTVLTVGAYPLWWFYKNWLGIKRQDGSSIWPAARALFSPISYFWLISDLNEHRDAKLGELNSLACVGYLALGIASNRLPDPYWMAAVVPIAFCLLPAARRIAEIEGPKALAANAPLRPRHYVLVVLFLIVWLALLFAPPEVAEG